MQEHIDLVCSEFKYVFKNILDKDHFEGKIYFRDPITNVSFFRGKDCLKQVIMRRSSLATGLLRVQI